MKKYVFYLILILLSLGLPLAGLELYGYYFEKDYAQFKNTYGDMHLYSQYRNHELNPDPNLFFPDSGMHHSPDGFKRDTPVAVEKPAGVYRIMMMGASALYGLGIKWPYPPHVGLKNSETVDRVVEAELNRELAARGEKTRVEIINSAVSGYTSLQQLTYFLENLYRYHSDMLVFLDGYNDYLVQKKDYRQFKDQPYFG